MPPEVITVWMLDELRRIRRGQDDCRLYAPRSDARNVAKALVRRGLLRRVPITTAEGHHTHGYQITDAGRRVLEAQEGKAA